MNPNQEQEKNQLAEIAKQQARKAIRKKAGALAKKAGKVVMRAAVHAVTTLIKTLLSFLASIGLPYLLIILGVLFMLFMVYLGTSLLFSSGDGLSGDAEKLRTYIIEQADKTVDMSQEEQIPYRVPHELIISALQIYDSTKHGKTPKEAVKLMAKTLKPRFEYEKLKGSMETEITTCIDGACSTTTSSEEFTIEPLVFVEAWDRVYTATYEPHTTDWVSNTVKGTTTKQVAKRDEKGKIIPGEYEEVTVSLVTTTKTRANTYIPNEKEEIDYTYFNRVLSEPPFEYGMQDKLTVEALYEATGGYIKYKEWLNGGSLIGGGFIGTVIPGAGVPHEFMQYYLEAEAFYGVDWYFLAAIHYVETGFSTHPTMVSSVGAEGHVQLCATFPYKCLSA